MSVAAEIRDQIQRAESGSYFRLVDLVAEHPGKRRAVEVALSRAAAAGDVVSVRRGLYWKGVKTRFGSTVPDALDAALAVAHKIAGKTSGVGPSGWTASHVLGLSTQIPACTHVAIPGRPPTSPPGVEFHSRPTTGREGLGVLEVALLEVLRAFPHCVESDWPGVVKTARSLAADGQVDPEKIQRAAQRERPAVRDRAAALVQSLTSTARKPVTARA